MFGGPFGRSQNCNINSQVFVPVFRWSMWSRVLPTGHRCEHIPTVLRAHSSLKCRLHKKRVYLCRLNTSVVSVCFPSWGGILLSIIVHVTFTAAFWASRRYWGNYFFHPVPPWFHFDHVWGPVVLLISLFFLSRFIKRLAKAATAV